MIGQTLSHYRVLDKLGAGGMGEVYRARDTRLGRDVAIKVLPPAFAQDRDRLLRFEREAQLLAALSHPNIAAIHGLEESDGQPYLVLEYVPGEMLRGPLPIDEVLTVARQIIGALEEAHERGIVHRDLKPANIKITPEGRVKVLDFGLAKALTGDSSDQATADAPTVVATALTRGAVLLGTAAYMSPEQARGKPVDKRSDIFSFGSVLYEMLTGKQAFGGETVSDSLAAILKNQPDGSLLPASTPSNVRRLLDRCLEKNPKLRLRDIGDARLTLDEPEPVHSAVAAVRKPAWKLTWLPWAVAALMTVAAGVALWVKEPPPTSHRAVAHLTAALPQRTGAGIAPITLSRDGSRLVYATAPGKPLYLRQLDELEAKPIPGTENAFFSFFSPDGQWLCFSQLGKMQKTLVTGGPTITLCDATIFGASWGTDGTIIFGELNKGLSRVSAAGGRPEILTTPDPKKGEMTHAFPEILPGGEAVLFAASHTGGWSDARIAVLSLKTRQYRVLIEGGVSPRYAPTGPAAPGQRGTGHIVYWRNATLFAVPFDLRRLEVTGSPVPVLEGVAGAGSVGLTSYSFSDTGTLAYIPGGLVAGTLVWADRQGQLQPLPAQPKHYSQPRLSPDGQRVALSIRSGETGDIWVYDIWVYDISRRSMTRLTFQGNNRSPVWTPDGKRVTFSRSESGKRTISWVPADGSGPVENLVTTDGLVSSWSPDGKSLLFSRGVPSRSDIWLMPLDSERKPRPFVQTQFDEAYPRISPDGRWVAYHSNESGEEQVYVRPAPGLSAAAGKWQVSIDGGSFPRWSASGRELFYRNIFNLMAVEIEPGPTFRSSTPKLLFTSRVGVPTGDYDVSPDGKRFLLIKLGSDVETGPPQAHLVFEWFEDLRRRVRGGR